MDSSPRVVRVWTFWAALLALVAASAIATPPALSGWTQLSTQHLKLVTDGDEAPARSLLRALEVMRLALSELGFGRVSGAGLPTTVFAFGTSGSYQPFRLHERSGQFFATPYENLIVVDALARSRSASVIASHEYLHALVSESGLSVPLWLNEGLAEYYSTIQVVGSRVVLGAPPPRHRRLLRGHAFLPFEQWLGTESRSNEYLDHEKASRFYAQSWLLVHYLMSDRERARQVAVFLDLRERGISNAVAFQQAFDLDRNELDKRLRSYLNQRRLPSFELSATVESTATRVDVQPLRPAEASMVLGLLATEQTRWHPTPQRVALAESLLSGAGRLAPLDGDVVAARAYLAETLGDRPSATALYERALYLDARNARSYALYARFLLDPDDEPVPAEDAEKARLALERALEIVPEHRALRALRSSL